MDYTLDNPKIKAFFNFESDTPPIEEFIQANEFFLQTNFLSQIEADINNVVLTTEYRGKDHLTCQKEVLASLKKIAPIIPLDTLPKKTEFLIHLRDIYKVIQKMSLKIDPQLAQKGV